MEETGDPFTGKKKEELKKFLEYMGLTVTWKLESVVTLENEKWVMGSDFLTKIGHEA